MALDAGFTTVVPYTAVELGDVAGLTQDAIFSRGPKGAKRTGDLHRRQERDPCASTCWRRRARRCSRPSQVSVFADPAGSFTTAAAMVAKVEKALKAKGGELEPAQRRRVRRYRRRRLLPRRDRALPRVPGSSLDRL